MQHGVSDFELTYEPEGLGKHNPNGGWVLTETRRLLITHIPVEDVEDALRWATAKVECEASQGVESWDAEWPSPPCEPPSPTFVPILRPLNDG